MPPKGKQGTKGQKQIVEENKETLDFYLKIIVAANVLYAIPTLLFYSESFTFLYQVLFLLTSAIYYGSYRTMKGMAKVSKSEDGTLLDGGVDLNTSEGMAEHIKDLIILTAAVQVLSLLSNYFWLLILLAPARAMYILWVNFLGPWFFAEAPEVDDKKAKKMERKLKRRS